MRADNGNKFGTKFGAAFQDYVGLCLHQSKLLVIEEDILQRTLNVQNSSKCVDFLVQETGCNVLIEAKGAELSIIGKLTHQSEPLLRSLKDTLVKAIIQGMTTMNRISATGGAVLRPNNYLVIVTYSPLYLGPASELPIILGPMLLDAIERKIGGSLPMSLSDVFVFSAEELERSCAHIAAGELSFEHLFKTAKLADANPRTSKYSINLHLDGILLGKKRRLMPKSEEAYDSLIQRAATALSF